MAPAEAETIAAIVARARASGVRVTLTGEGDAVTSMGCQVVREALTNVAKHAPGAAATVTVRERAGWTEIEVVNEAPAIAPEPDRPSSRLGLAGLRRGVEALGGEFRVGWRGSGFALYARFPDGPHPARRHGRRGRRVAAG